jgi:LysR family transcriptional regulator, nitrogen assimilation regulatory protein
MGGPQGRQLSQLHDSRRVEFPLASGDAMLDLRDLRYFIAVYEAGGFGRAAAILKVAQSNVSTRILRLERLLGAPVFERRHRSIAPTARGELLYRHAVRVLEEVDELELTLRAREAG